MNAKAQGGGGQLKAIKAKRKIEKITDITWVRLHKPSTTKTSRILFSTTSRIHLRLATTLQRPCEGIRPLQTPADSEGKNQFDSARTIAKDKQSEFLYKARIDLFAVRMNTYESN